MLELLLSLDHETSKLFDWLEPQEILELTCVNHKFHQACQQWCQTRGIPRQVAMKRAEIAGICDCLEQMQVQSRMSIRTSSLAPSGRFKWEDLESDDEDDDDESVDERLLEFHEPWTRNPDTMVGLAMLFQSYQGFLDALLRTPLNDSVLNLPSWSKRYWMLSRPRPPAIRQGFDFGESGYWCDAFGCGAPNDYFRLVGDGPNQYWSLCLAGSDAHHIRWRNASNNDRTIDPVPSQRTGTEGRKKAPENSNGIDNHSHPRSSNIDKSCTQISDEPTEWDKTRQYWRDCAARVRPSCSWILEI